MCAECECEIEMPQQLMLRRVDYLVSTDFYGSFILWHCDDVFLGTTYSHATSSPIYVELDCMLCWLERLLGSDTYNFSSCISLLTLLLLLLLFFFSQVFDHLKILMRNRN